MPSRQRFVGPAAFFSPARLRASDSVVASAVHARRQGALLLDMPNQPEPPGLLQRYNRSKRKSGHYYNRCREGMLHRYNRRYSVSFPFPVPSFYSIKLGNMAQVDLPARISRLSQGEAYQPANTETNSQRTQSNAITYAAKASHSPRHTWCKNTCVPSIMSPQRRRRRRQADCRTRIQRSTRKSVRRTGVILARNGRGSVMTPKKVISSFSRS
jgi:hypothetical protein